MASANHEIGRAGPPAVLETHLSTLFFYGDRVLKLRRPAAYPFADFSRVSTRREDCAREVELNGRLAPDVYLGTATISLGGAPVEHGVLMRRLPAARNLEHLVRTGARPVTELRAVAATLAAFHARAPRSARIDAAATAAALWQRWQSTEDALGRFLGGAVPAEDYRALGTRARRFLDGRDDLFAQRVEQGAICDGHGDLQAADIFCLPDGPRLIDCLEFDDELRYTDVLADAAFLAEDLERLGAPDLAGVFLDAYRLHAGGDQPPPLVDFYIACRAHVRLLVACLRLELGLSSDQAEPGRVLRLADAHLAAALPRLVLVGGPPGSGKTTLARWLGTATGAEVLSSDLVRRAVAPGTSHARRRYSPAARSAVYERMLERAAVALRRGRSVVLDATWQTRRLRRLAAALADATSSDLVQLRCDAPAAARSARVVDRLARGAGASEATVAVARELAQREDPWPEAIRVDTARTPEEGRAAALRAVREPRPA